MEVESKDFHLCVLCGENLSDFKVVKVSVGLSTLTEASKNRHDNLWHQWEKYTSIVVHEKCRKSYTNERNVSAVTKRNIDNRDNEN